MFKSFRTNLIFITLVLFIFQGILFAQTENNSNNPEKNQNEKVETPNIKNSEDLVHFGDLIEVDVIGSTEFDWRGTINPEGFLDGVDFIDEPIFALCRNEEDVAKDLTKGFSKMLRNPQVVVKILDRSGRPVSYLYGAIKTPQRFKLNREVRLNELIILSGGVTEKASGEIQILRSRYFDCNERKKNSDEQNQTVKIKQEIGTESIKVNITDLIQGKKDANPLILNGDIVTILESDPIYVIGGVTNPRQINSTTKMSLTRAIASAGGFSKDADSKNIQIYRKVNNERKSIEVDFAKIESDETQDIILEKFDIVEVGQRGREKRKVPPVIKNADTAIIKTLEMPLRVIE